MKLFADNAGRNWTLSLTIDAAKRVRGLLGVNLLELDAGDPPLLTKLGTDVILLCDVIYCLVKPQADAAGVSDEQFGAALGGEAIHAAQTAFYEELSDFFRKLGRGDLAKAAPAQRRLIDLAVTRIETRIDRLDLETAIETILGEDDSTPGEPLKSSPPLPVANPAR